MPKSIIYFSPLKKYPKKSQILDVIKSGIVSNMGNNLFKRTKSAVDKNIPLHAARAAAGIKKINLNSSR